MISMNDRELLLNIQEIDGKIDDLNLKEKKLPERDRFLKLSEEVAKIETLFKAMSAKLHDETSIQKRIDDELRTLNTKAEREQNRLYSGSIVNPKELSNVQQEVANLKEQIDEKELALLEQLEIVEKMKSDCNAVEARLNLRTSEMKEVKAEMDRLLAEIVAARKFYQTDRIPVYEALSEDARSLYDRVRQKHQVAVTILENGLCQGCRVELPSTDYERILKSAKLERCTNCGRIIAKSS
jgi:predicted  nucleic acid-binding Zn-ribbon protein